MKKIFTLVSAALFAVNTFAVDDLVLDLNAITSGWSGGYDASKGELSFGGWDSKGWEFFPSVSTSEYSGIALVLTEATTVPLEIKYEGDKVQTVSSLSTSETINFSESGMVVSIKFANGGDGGTVKLTGATLKGIATATAVKPTTDLTLPFDKIRDAGWGVSKDDAAHTITINQYSSAGWNIVPGVSTESYSGIKFTLTQAPQKGGSILVKYNGWVSGADNTAFEQTIEVSGTAVEASFDKSGIVVGLQFRGDGWHSNEGDDADLGPLTYGIGDCRLVKNTDATGISSTAAAEVVSSGAIYTLSGQRVGKSSKGLYIVNGRKIVFK